MYYRKAILALIVASLAACGDSSDKNSIPTFGQTSYQISTDEDQATSLTVSATDEDSGDTIAYSISNVAANGSVDLNSETGEITYTPNANFFGEDSIEVTATDGEDSSTVTVTITVSAVNDLPVIDLDQVVVSGGETKSGQITATDIDGDSLTYAIEEAPANGELTIDSATGAIQYTAKELVSVDDSFTLKVTDGQGGEVSKALTIKTSLNSNADRAFYYYSNEASHLKKAEALIGQLEDDVNQGLVFNNLAVGYAQAGLIAQVERLVTTENIVRDEQLARTMLDVSRVYNQLGQTNKADEYRLKANSLYSQYLAIKGLEAFGSEDSDFYRDLSNSYKEAGNFEQAEKSLDILDQLFKSVIGNTTAGQRTFFMYRNLVDDAVQNWQSTGLAEDKALALEMTDNLYAYANLIAKQEQVDDATGDVEYYYATRTIGLNDATSSYIELNELDKAKEPLLDLMALYGLVGIDDKLIKRSG